MGALSRTSLVLNIVPLSFTKEVMKVGRMPKLDEVAYRQMREMHWQTHTFRYDQRTEETLNVTLDPKVTPLGTPDEVKIQEHLLLAARAIQHNILLWLMNRRPILRSNKKLIFWGEAEDALLLSRALEKVGAEKVPHLEVVLRYEIDCRMFQYGEDQLYLGMVINLATSNVIDIAVSELQQRGLDIVGRYVCRQQEFEQDYLRPRLELLGQVSRTEGSTLLLTDTEGINQIAANEARLEPRPENLKDVVKLYYGSKAPGILTTLEGLRRPINTATGKLARIRETLAGLKRRPIIIANEVSVELGDLLTFDDDKFPDQITTQRPSLLFGPQGRNRGSLPDVGVKSYGPYMYMQHERNRPLLAVICEAQYRGQVEQFVKSLLDGFPNELWQNPKKPNPFPEGLIGKYRLLKVRVEYEVCQAPTPQAYREATTRLLNRLPETPDLALIQIKETFTRLYGNTNPYLVSKAALMMVGVPTQAIRIENINLPPDNLAFLLNNISLATYAKLDGIPWVIATYKPTSHELVVGLGSAEVGQGRLGAKTRYVGITTVFQGDGRYLVWGLTREVEFEHYAEALLESLRTTVRYVQQHNTWEPGDKVRLVCHVYKRLRDSEVEAIKALVQELVTDKYEVEFAFLDISWWHPYYLFDQVQSGVSDWDWESRRNRIKGKGVPERGLCFQLDKMRALLHLTGPRDVKTEMQGLPTPLFVELHPDSDFTDMTYLLRQMYHFTYMSWRSFFPGTAPVTITYSRLIAKLLGHLKAVEGWHSQVLAGASLRDRRWFL